MARPPTKNSAMLRGAPPRHPEAEQQAGREVGQDHQPSRAASSVSPHPGRQPLRDRLLHQRLPMPGHEAPALPSGISASSRSDGRTAPPAPPPAPPRRAGLVPRDRSRPGPSPPSARRTPAPPATPAVALEDPRAASGATHQIARAGAYQPPWSSSTITRSMPRCEARRRAAAEARARAAGRRSRGGHGVDPAALGPRPGLQPGDRRIVAPERIADPRLGQDPAPRPHA